MEEQESLSDRLTKTATRYLPVVPPQRTGLWIYDVSGGGDPFHPDLNDHSEEANLMRTMRNALGGDINRVKALLRETHSKISR